ncbi:DMT family transporter [Vibrio sp. JC009]|uniref:DMT family transporter n=1 Tax=Vibrio sp. JC009 TaxID=2912314 RepID=UPI0023B1DC8C|nr:DMT family transporter [Vibrio sp. JC009]WED24305.1 DMT family transporter [Vibrio sp. JC009]
MAGTFFIMIACLTWALDTLIRYPLLNAGYSTLQIVLLEHVTLFLITLPLLIRHRNEFKNLSGLGFASLMFIGGIGSAIGTLAFTQAFQYLNPTVVILLQKLQPLVAILCASWLLKEQIRKHFVIWALVILAGSLTMIWPDITNLSSGNLHYSDQSKDILLGYGYTLLAVFAWGMATVCGKYLSRSGMSANAIMSGRFTTGLLVLTTLALISPEQIGSITGSDLGSLVLMALLSGLVGMWLYYQGLKQVPAQVATLAEMTFPVFAALINWWVLDMSLNEYQIAGAALLILGNLEIRRHELAQHVNAEPQNA